MLKGSTVPFLALSALVLSACGSSGPSLSEFKQGFAADKAAFSAIGNDVGVALQTAPKKTNAELATEFSVLASRAAQQQTNLQALKAPSKYRHDLTTLISDFTPVIADLRAIAAAARADNAKAAETSAASLVRHSVTLKSADVGLSRALGIPLTQ
jgi:hypothetical protein